MNDSLFFIFYFFLMVVLCVGFLFSMFRIYRSSKVYAFRLKLLYKINDRVKEDMSQGKDGYWRFDVYDSVEYDEMMQKFWKPLNSFYPDKTFLSPTNLQERKDV